MPIKEGKTLCLMPTFRCTAECDNCGTFSSPRESNSLSLAQMKTVIDQAVSDNYCKIVFTGGEPTLAGDDLLKAMRHAALAGLHVKMVTNAHWASDIDTAEKCVREFISNGLAEINFSTGNRHSGFVPTQNIIRALRASIPAGLIVSVLIETTGNDSVNRETIENNSDFQAMRRDFPDAPLEIVDWVWTPISPFRTENYPENLTINKNKLANCGGCDDIQKNITVQADGNISPCCGLGIRLVSDLKLGKTGETSLLEADQIAGNNLLLQKIKSDGPERILARAAEIDSTIKWENMYAHRCQACIRIFKDSKIKKAFSEHAEEFNKI